jgi:hypothetical protein
LGSENVFYFGTEGVCACEVRNTIRATKKFRGGSLIMRLFIEEVSLLTVDGPD